MTNEEAINVLEDYDINFERHTAEAIAEAHEMAIKALEEQPSERTEERAETHECDCISRKAIIDALHRYFADGFDSDKWWNSMYVLGAINEVPSATPQPKTGHWTHDGGYWKNRWICSECGHKLYAEQSKYCPECGARMEVQK